MLAQHVRKPTEPDSSLVCETTLGRIVAAAAAAWFYIGLTRLTQPLSQIVLFTLVGGWCPSATLA